MFRDFISSALTPVLASSYENNHTVIHICHKKGEGIEFFVYRFFGYILNSYVVHKKFCKERTGLYKAFFMATIVFFTNHWLLCTMHWLLFDKYKTVR